MNADTFQPEHETDTIPARIVHRLVPTLRGPWETGSGGRCVCCNRRPPSRLDPDETDAARDGPGYFTCATCRSKADAALARREWPAGAGDGSYQRWRSFAPHPRPDRGECIRCGTPALLRGKHYAAIMTARAQAELLNTTVARLNSQWWCAQCKPRSVGGRFG